MPGPWIWEPAAHVCRNTATGRFMGHADMLAMRDTFSDAMATKATDLARRVGAGDIDLATWQKAMRSDIRTSYIDQYVLGRGGRSQMTQADWGRVGQLVREQYGYLGNFARDIADGNMTEAQIAARAQLYHHSSVRAFELGRARSYGDLKLPAYPGDGSTACRVNCRCHWDIRPTETGWDCYWMLGATERTCGDCLGRARDWSPYVVESTSASKR
jgi:hypothetical protein